MTVNNFFNKMLKQLICLTICLLGLSFFSPSLKAFIGESEAYLAYNIDSNHAITSSNCEGFKAKVVIIKLPDCGQSNGAVNIEVIGGTGAISFSWGNSSRMDSLSAGSYWVTIKDENGCEVIVDFELKGQNCPPCTLAATANITQPSCKRNDGSFCLNVTGANGPINYDWGSGDCYENLVSGNYSVIISDDVCNIIVNVQLLEPSPIDCPISCTLAVNAIINKQPTCKLVDGSVCINVTGAVGPVRLSWGTETCYDNLIPGTYSVLVSDDVCSVVVNFELLTPLPDDCTQPCTLSANAVINKQPTCKLIDGSVCINVEGANGPVKLSWGTETCYDNLVPGTYHVTVSDDVCSVLFSFELDAPPQEECFVPCTLLANAVVNKEPTCKLNDGSVCINIEGANGPVKLSWGPVTCYDNLVPGYYSIIVTDDICSKIVSFELKAPPPETCGLPCTLKAKVTINGLPTCNSNDGSVCINTTGAQGDVKIDWGPEMCKNDLAPGNYSVLVSDDVCSMIVCFELKAPPPESCPPALCTLIGGYEIINRPECELANGEVAITHTGAKSTVTYIWEDAILVDSRRVGLLAGSYQVIIQEDSSDCADTIHFTLEKTGLAELKITPDSVCTDSLGGLNYEVTGCFESPINVRIFNDKQELVASIEADVEGKGRFEDLVSEENYEIVAIGADGQNIGRASFIIGAFPDFEVDETVSSICDANGFISLKVEGGNEQYNFNWTDTAGMDAMAVRNNLDSGSYTVVIEHKLTGCKLAETYFIDKAVGPDITVDKEILTCTGDSIQLNVINNKADDILDYLWDFGTVLMSTGTDIPNPIVYSDEQITDLKATLTVTNQFECKDTKTIKITVRDTVEKPFLDLLASTNCESTLVNYENRNANSALFYWDFGDLTTEEDTSSMQNPSYLYPEKGDYLVSLKLSPKFVCRKQKPINIDTLISVNEPLDLNAAIRYDKFPCVKPTEITFANVSTINSGKIDDFSWQLNGKLLENPKDTLLLDVTDLDIFDLTLEISSGVCTDDHTERVIIKDISTKQEVDEACEGALVSLVPIINIPNAVFDWDENGFFADTTQNPMVVVDSRIQVTGRAITEDECINIEITIDPKSPPTYELTGKTAVCMGDEKVLIGVVSSDVENFLWSKSIEFGDTLSNANELIAPIGTYYVLLDNGCAVIDSLVVTQRAVLAEIETPPAFCTPITLNLQVNNLNEADILKYQWSPIEMITPRTDTTAVAEVNISTTTEFTVEMQNQFGCKSTKSVVVTVSDTSSLANYEITANQNNLEEAGTFELSLNQSLPEGYSIVWESEISLNTSVEPAIANPTEKTTYTVNIILDGADESCAVQRDITLEPRCDLNSLFFPNAFSPNNDNRNDILLVRGAEGFEAMTLIVYNRWGQKVFESDDPKTGWDGHFEGEPVGADVYGYYLTVTCPTETIVKKGNVTVLK